MRLRFPDNQGLHACGSSYSCDRCSCSRFETACGRQEEIGVGADECGTVQDRFDRNPQLLMRYLAIEAHDHGIGFAIGHIEPRFGDGLHQRWRAHDEYARCILVCRANELGGSDGARDNVFRRDDKPETRKFAETSSGGWVELLVTKQNGNPAVCQAPNVWIASGIAALPR